MNKLKSRGDKRMRPAYDSLTFGKETGLEDEVAKENESEKGIEQKAHTKVLRNK
ncbi:MAG: hypothetical protein PHX30_04295 [Candidatus Pacebacteria bacterium]|nr:hypothetical protein [Candidatus Paceibacterota bacterium]